MVTIMRRDEGRVTKLVLSVRVNGYEGRQTKKKKEQLTMMDGRIRRTASTQNKGRRMMITYLILNAMFSTRFLTQFFFKFRSCKDEYLVPMNIMQARVKAVSAARGLDESSIDVANLMSHAVHEYIKNTIEKLATIAQHRIDLVTKVRNFYL